MALALSIPVGASAAKIDLDLDLVGVNADVNKGGVDVGVDVPPVETNVKAEVKADETGVGVDVDVNSPTADVNAQVGGGSGDSGSSTNAESGSGSKDSSPSGDTRSGGSDSPAARTAANDGRANDSSRSTSNADKKASRESAAGSDSPSGSETATIAASGSGSAGAAGTDPSNDVETSVISRVVAYIPDWLWMIIGALFAVLAIVMAWGIRERRRRRVSDGVAMRDPLTDVGNVKAFNDQLARAWSFARRHNETFGVMMIDLDKFKQVNDKHGHAAGDLVLVETAKHLANSTRTSDFVARIGGDEFAIICPHTDLEGLETLRSKLENHSLSTENVEVGISVGVAELREGDVAPADIVERADVSMYDRKRERRDEVGTPAEKPKASAVSAKKVAA